MSALVISEAREAAALRRCFPVMAELRPHLDEAAFVAAVQRMLPQGYRLSLAAEAGADGEALGVAGWRIHETLVRGRMLYIDDLVTRADRRSRGVGKALLDHLIAIARNEGCQALELDSGCQRSAAHRFYFREGLVISSFHFQRSL